MSQAPAATAYTAARTASEPPAQKFSTRVTPMLGRRSAMPIGRPPRPVPTSLMCVENHAASSCSGPIPASLMASPYASTIKSSGLASQRSPKRLQPMPKMTTLSLIPVGYSVGLRLGEPAGVDRTGVAFQK